MKENEGGTSITEIVSQYYSRLFSYIRHKVDSREDAEDILQDVFYQLSRSVSEGENDIERISGWLYRVAHNSILNFWRKKSAVAIGDLSVEEGDEIDALSEMLFGYSDTEPESDYLRKLVWQELEIALSELPIEQSEIFCMTVFDGIPVKVIAENLQIPVATVLSRKHYAVKHIRIRMRGLYDDMINS